MADPVPTALLVHGAHSGAWVWEDVRPHLKCDHLALDLPGHGPRTEPLAGVTFDACVATIVDAAKNLPRVFLVGHSMSCPIVLVAAEKLATRLGQITLIAGPVPRPGNSIVDTLPFIPRMVSRLVLSMQTQVFGQPDGMARRSLLNGVAADRIDRACQRFTLESTRIVLAPVNWSGKPAAPTTYVRCLRDKGALSPSHQAAMAERLGPGSRTVSLDTCHYPMMERPAEVAALIDAAASQG